MTAAFDRGIRRQNDLEFTGRMAYQILTRWHGKSGSVLTRNIACFTLYTSPGALLLSLPHISDLYIHNLSPRAHIRINHDFHMCTLVFSVLASQTHLFVDNKFPAHGVEGSTNSNAYNDAKRDQLRRNLS